MKPSPLPPQMPERRIPKILRRPVKKYATTIGELIWAASKCQASFGDLFSVLVDSKDVNPGMAIWHSIPGDKVQIEALEALLKIRAAPTSRLYRNTQWAVAAVYKLRVIRNDAAHMPTSPTLIDSGITLIPNPIGNDTSRLKRRTGTDFLNLFSKAAGDYRQIQQYVHDIFCHLAWPDHCSLPLRPKLVSVVLKRPASSANHQS
jgi:hypothetical protein